ncbi:hypothetical protein RBH48_25955, partial [Escherichia coli]
LAESYQSSQPNNQTHHRKPKHRKGDLIQVHGNLQVNRYQDKYGQQKEGWQLLAQSIISSETTR